MLIIIIKEILMTSPNFYAWLYAPAQRNKTSAELAQLFIESGPNLLNDQNKTPLHYTANEVFNGQDKFRLTLIKLLFAQKIDANAVDNNGRTALHDFAEKFEDIPWFFLNSFVKLAEVFFKNGAKFNIQNTDGNIPLDLLLGRSDPNPIVIKVLIQFMLLEQPELNKPNSIDSHDSASNYWKIYKNNIAELREQKIPGTECTFYDICATKNLTQLIKQYYSQHQQIRNFDPEKINNKFHDYSDQLLVNLKSLQQGMIKILNTNTTITKTNLILAKNHLSANEDVIREIFKYLPDKEIQNMHKAAHPSLFKNKKTEISKQTDMQDKTAKNCCCIL